MNFGNYSDINLTNFKLVNNFEYFQDSWAYYDIVFVPQASLQIKFKKSFWPIFWLDTIFILFFLLSFKIWITFPSFFRSIFCLINYFHPQKLNVRNFVWNVRNTKLITSICLIYQTYNSLPIGKATHKFSRVTVNVKIIGLGKIFENRKIKFKFCF